MTRTWLLFERLFAIIEIAIALLFILYFDYVGERDYTLLNILSDTNVFILHLLFLSGGILLLLNEKVGWMISLPMWSLFLIGSCIFMSSQGGWDETEVTVLLLCLAIGFAFVIFILQKPFLDKYQISKKNWAIVAGMIPVIIILACWHHLF